MTVKPMNNPIPWPAEMIWEQVYPLLPDFTVEVLPEIDSSNSELMRRARMGQREPTLLVAECQTAGRGRMGRVWQSEPGDSLTFSLGLPLAPASWSGLSLAVGLSLAESLHPDVGLKWPNDLWFQDRKLGGILIEAASMGGLSQVVVGVGLNIRPRLAEGLNTAPAALTELLPEVTAPAALQRIALGLVRSLLDFENAGFAPLQRRFEARDVLKGRPVCTSDGLQGHSLGVSPVGALVLQTLGGRQEIHSAEVSVRPRSEEGVC
jgi:BirA family biotin operon repressor/biotin-[acetyl-CoA-carboxylase] ligase